MGYFNRLFFSTYRLYNIVDVSSQWETSLAILLLPKDFSFCVAIGEEDEMMKDLQYVRIFDDSSVDQIFDSFDWIFDSVDWMRCVCALVSSSGTHHRPSSPPSSALLALASYGVDGCRMSWGRDERRKTSEGWANQRTQRTQRLTPASPSTSV